MIRDVVEQTVDEIIGEVVTLLWRCRWVDPMIVLDKLGKEVVGQSFEEAIVLIEAAPQGPLVIRPSAGGLIHRGQVPLPEGGGVVATITKQLLDHGGPW